MNPYLCVGPEECGSSRTSSPVPTRIKNSCQALRLVGNIYNMHVHIYVQHITITDIRNFMHSYHGLIQVLMLITGLCLFETPVGVTELILFKNTLRYYRSEQYTFVSSYSLFKLLSYNY